MEIMVEREQRRLPRQVTGSRTSDGKPFYGSDAKSLRPAPVSEKKD